MIVAETVAAPSVTWYVTGDAVPEKTPVHAGVITGLFTPLQGVNVTTPEALTVYFPWPSTTKPDDAEPNVQFGATSPPAQNFTDETVNVLPVAALSLDRTLIVCAAPETPDDTSFPAAAGVAYAALTTPFVPTASVDAFDTSDVAAVLSVVEPEPPAVTVVEAIVFTPASSKRTL